MADLPQVAHGLHHAGRFPLHRVGFVALHQRINALVNYWWQPVRPAGYAADTVLGCLMHCVLAFRTLPPAQRGAWRTLLDHYVFGDGDPVAHIPAGRRGILGPLTPEQLAEARASIRRYL